MENNIFSSYDTEMQNDELTSMRQDIVTTLTNIEEFFSRQETDLGHIKAFADELSDTIRRIAGKDTEQMCAIFREIAEAQDHTDKNSTAISEMYNGLHLMLLKRYLSMSYSGDLVPLFNIFTSEDVLGEDALGRISYVKNNFTEKAFWSFSKIISHPKASYSTNFEESCQDIYNGVSEYCILPIENSGDGRLTKFYSLIDKYDIKICAVCDVESHDASSTTRFALLKRNIYTPDILIKYGFDIFLEISFAQSDNLKISDILKAADFFEVDTVRIDSMHLSYTDDSYKFYTVFSATPDKILKFLVYLYIYAREFLPIGIYKRI